VVTSISKLAFCFKRITSKSKKLFGPERSLSELPQDPAVSSYFHAQAPPSKAGLTPGGFAHTLSYRPEVDGLRAIAVLSVFVFHLQREWLPGGFVGVDVFFVISGYLITSILLQDCDAKIFSLPKFYQRRIARLFPAFFTVALTTIVGTTFVYQAQDFASAGATLVAASLSVANIKFMMQGNYFELSPDAQPFLHYWSLSVEEQFYLLYPVLLFLTCTYARQRLATILAAVGLTSYAASVTLTPHNSVLAFYLLPTRAWELCLGALVAAFQSLGMRGPTVFAPRWCSLIGILMIGSSFLIIREGDNFPGWVAAIPAVGAAAILISSVERKDWVNTALSSGVLVAIGRMSYSLYLWHWPAFCLIDYRFFELPVSARMALKIVTPIVFTVTTYHCIERPARFFLKKPTNREIAYVFFATMLAICVPLGLTIRKDNYVNAELSDVRNGGLVFLGHAGSPSVVLMGDSKASMYGKTVKEICAELGYDLTVISVAAGNPLPSRMHGSSALWVDSLAVVRQKKPDYLIFAAAWATKLKGEPERLAVTLDALGPYAKHIVLLNEPPILPDNASRDYVRKGGQGPFRESEELRIERLRTDAYLRSFQSPGVSVIDIARHFELGDGEVMFMDNRRRLLYHDADHLSDDGTDHVRDVLIRALTGQG
jgi:peptidoglycan/LPS O-acetylase OafA/YrhL